MTGVVLRCPSCGTATGTPGDCGACHEAQVRYYCTNHTPGRWLESPACLDCGARFGAEVQPPAAPSAGPSRMPAAGSAPASSRRPRYSSRAPTEAVSTGPVRTRDPTAPAEGESVYRGEEPRRDPRMLAWQELLLAAARRRPAAREPVPTGSGLGGCLLRLVLIVVFLFLALAAGLVVFGASLLQMFRF
jgi:hypothetical protein